MVEGDITSPRIVSSRRRIKYRRSEWSVQECEVASGGGSVCRAGVVRLRDSALVWCGTAPLLREVALGMPGDGPDGALACPLLGAGEAAPMARRLAAARRSPVYVCCGDAFDRFTWPLVERALLSLLETEVRPDQ